jgi:tetratricopeptide (TPR) repeat protein
MKQYLVLIFLLICSFTTYSQNYFQEGDKCFEEGDYACAETKYLELYKSASEANMDFGEIKIKRAKLCKENLKNANLAFNSKNYSKAKELYLAVLDSNPNDATAKSKLEIINTLLSKPKTTTLSLSKTDISFESSGGSISISVDSNFNSYTINLLPTWCTVQKYDKYFVIKCSSYNASTLRRDYFNVIAGDKTIRVNVVQQGTSSVKENYLNVSKTNLAFSSKGGYDEVKVTTNGVDFTVKY